jgi:ABC-2 type transport system permease protein
MTRALFLKALSDSKYLLIALLFLMVLFTWFDIWTASMISAPALAEFLANSLPQRMQRISAVPISELATPAGHVAVAFAHPIVLFGTAIWAIARGSDCVSGEIGRGTMEMLLAQPVSRTKIFATHSLATILGSLLLAVAVWFGIVTGLATSSLGENLSATRFIAPSANLFARLICISGVAALVSSWDSQRWRTVGLLGAWYVVSMILELVSRLVDGCEWVKYLSFMTAYSHQQMAAHPDQAWNLLAYRDGALVGIGLGGQQLVLVAIGLLAYIAGAIIFNRREIPAPI